MTKKNMVDVITLTGVEAILSVVFFFDDGSVWNILLEKIINMVLVRNGIVIRCYII